MVDITTKRAKSREYSRRTYANNRIFIARNRILRAIDKGKCVLGRTLENPKYNWTKQEKKMLKRCIKLRKNRYIISPENITFINDLRYKTPYPTAHPQNINISSLSVEEQITNIEQNIQSTESDYIKSILIQKRNELLAFKEFDRLERDDDEQRINIENYTTHKFSELTNDELVYKVSKDITHFIDKKVKATLNDCKKAITHLIMTDKLVTGRNMSAKKQNEKNYHNDLRRIFDDLRIKDFYDLYRFPGRYINIIQHIKKSKTVDFMIYLIYNVIWKHGCVQQSNHKVGEVFEKVCELVPENIADVYGNFHQILKVEKRMRQTHAMNNASYYDWSKIYRIYDSFKISEKHKLRDIRDKIIIYIYTRSNVLRDNLGSVEFEKTKITNIKNVNYNYIYYNSSISCYVLLINDFKNVKYRFSKSINLSKDISKIIKEYIEVYKKKFKKSPKYLITTDKGDGYADGKIGGYIITMFKRLSGARNLGINQLRHSFATYYKDDTITEKTEKAKMMQHNLEQHILYERHSKKITPIPLFDNAIDDSNDYYINKRCQVKITREKSKYFSEILSGVIKKTSRPILFESTPYTIVFDKTEPDLLCSLPNNFVNIQDTGFYWINRRVKVKINEGRNKGKEMTGTVYFNDKTLKSGYYNTQDDYTYVVKYDDTSEEDDLFTDFPDEDVIFI